MSLVNHHPLLQSPVSAECDIADVAVGWTRPYKLAELKRINKLWTADSIHLRKTLYIPVIPPPTSLDFQLRHAPSAHPDNIRRIKRERQSTDSEATMLSPLSSITGSANAKSIEDLLHQIDEDVSNVCEALAQLDSMPHATSSLLHRSESFSKASVLTAKTSMVETGDSCGINLITSSTTRVTVCRSPTEDTSSTRLTSPTRTSLQEFPPKNVEIVIELTPLLRRLPLTAQRAVAEDVRRRTASSFSTMDTFVSPNIVIQQPSRAEVTVKTVKIASSDQSWTSTAKNNLLSLP
ncbi:hypothetical protein BC829DRAFT_405995 [Chytridium lagenaria]|nr:hypothetical protein BC829DRAFT_405995 [Chytridium lagenaria]